MLDNARFVNSLDRLIYLRTLSFLGNIEQSELAVIAEHTRERSFRKGENLLSEGQPVGAIHLVVDGKVEASREGKAFRVFGAGDAVGVMGLLAGTDEGVQARALSNTVTLELRAQALHDVFEDHFAILDHVLRNLCRLLIAERKQLSTHGGFALPEADSLVCPARPLDFVERMFVLRKTFPTTFYAQLRISRVMASGQLCGVVIGGRVLSASFRGSAAHNQRVARCVQAR